MAEKPQYMARLVITKLDQTGEKIDTMVKATTLEKLTSKITTILSTMEEGVDL